MKKILAVMLLVICNLAAFTAAAAFNVFIFFLTGFGLAATVIIGLFPLCAMGYGLSYWERIFAEKFALKKMSFFLISHIPPVICAAVCLAEYLRLDALGYFSGFLNLRGAFWLPFTVSLIAAAVIHPVSSMVWCHINKIYLKGFTNESKN